MCHRPAAVVDHVLPLALGGTDERSNKRALCDDCHSAETRRQFGARK